MTSITKFKADLILANNKQEEYKIPKVAKLRQSINYLEQRILGGCFRISESKALVRYRAEYKNLIKLKRIK